MQIERARAVADAVLFEGYALYPYRPTSTKNQLRWQFGVLAPRAASEATKADPWWLESQLLVAPAGEGVVEGVLRFLRVRRRRLETPGGEPLASVEVGGNLLVPWDEGELCEVAIHHRPGGPPTRIEAAFEADRDEELVTDLSGTTVRVIRTRGALALVVQISDEPLDDGKAARLSIRVENVTPSAEPLAPRDATLPSATLGTHLVLGVEGARFVSLYDPPAWAEEAAAGCRSVGSYPVLAGGPGTDDLALCAPLILYDHPQVAPESPGDLFDATEIDEILTLRTMLLTDEEKRLARATDPRVAQLLDRVDRLPAEALGRLHGAIRERSAALVVGGTRIAPGSRVRLRPGARRSDAQDMFLDGRVATVRAVERDVDGRDCLAVTVDGDPGAELHLWRGRYHYFYLDEIEPVVAGEAG